MRGSQGALAWWYGTPTKRGSRVSTDTPVRPGKRTTDQSGTGLGRPWQVVVANDSVNTFPHVIALFCRVLPGMDTVKAERLALAIHTRGREAVWSGHQELAEHYAAQLADGGLLATCEPSG